MKYLQNGGYQSHPLMRLTLSLALLLLAGFVATNFLLYFAKMGVTPGSVADYYRGSEEDFRPPRTFQSMLEVTHFHLPMMALVLLLLTHLAIFAPLPAAGKKALIIVAFSSGLLSEGSSWLVRFAGSGFAWLKIVSFLALQASLIFLVVTLALFLLRPRRGSSKEEIHR